MWAFRMATAFSKAGFTGSFLGRVDEMDKSNRGRNSNLQFLWRGSPSVPFSEIFTSVLLSDYTTRYPYSWEDPHDNPHNPHITEDNQEGGTRGNYKSVIQDLYSMLAVEAAFYRSSNIMMLMGGDFTYGNNSSWYKNMDKIVKYGGENRHYIFEYSSPSSYINEIYQSGLDWSSQVYRNDDFLPYSDYVSSYWSGTFSNRPSFKRLERVASNSHSRAGIGYRSRNNCHHWNHHPKSFK
jgi:hypothetical protein